jgi:hypothetical protein
LAPAGRSGIIAVRARDGDGRVGLDSNGCST